METVALIGGSAPPDLALDAVGRPRVLACPPGEVRYAIRGNLWSDELVTETVGGGICGVLALGTDGTAYVNFYIPPDGLPADRRFAVRENETWRFHSTPVNAGDMVVDSGNVVHAVARAASNPNLVYAKWQNGTWAIEDIGFYGAGFLGSAWASLRLDSTGTPHVLYFNDLIGEVRYAIRDASAWRVEAVEHIGSIGVFGRQGDLALDMTPAPHAVFYVRTGPTTAELRYATRGTSGWNIERLDAGIYPSLSVGGDGIPQAVYTTGSVFTRIDLAYARRIGGSWPTEVIDTNLAAGGTPKFASLALDGCDNPHVAYAVDGASVDPTKYATKGTCDPEPEDDRTAALRLTPETLNLKSKGRWVTARLSLDNASVHDLDVRSLELNGVPADKWKGAGRILVAKFDRQAVAATLSPGTEEVLLTGTWTDGTPFTATDTVRVIRPGKGPR